MVDEDNTWRAMFTNFMNSEGISSQEEISTLIDLHTLNMGKQQVPYLDQIVEQEKIKEK